MADFERERGSDDDDFDEDAPFSSDPSSSSSTSAPPAPSFVHPAALGKTCALCGVDFSGGRKLMRCSGCRLAHYCSREHQAAHWPAHSEACNAEQARVKAQLSESGLVLGAEAAREAAARKAEDERAAAAATERARIEALDAPTLRLELDRRGALAALAADAGREALVAARLAAPAPTPETLAASGEREQRALELRQCRSCEKAMPAEPASTGRCAGCKRVRYCCKPCQLGDWPRHKADCKAWRAEADAAVVAAGGCPLGNLEAQEAFGKEWAGIGVSETVRAAEGGNLAAQFALGERFVFGLGMEKDLEQGLRWLRSAAEGNVLHAQEQIGHMLVNGDLDWLDLSEADVSRCVLLVGRAASAGSARGQHALAGCLYKGRGGRKDWPEALRLYHLSAAQGLAKSQSVLARVYTNGEGVARNFETAREWAQRAAAQDEPAGEYALFLLDREGLGGPRDLRAAVRWGALAASKGHALAVKDLRTLAASGVVEATKALRRLQL